MTNQERTELRELQNELLRLAAAHNLADNLAITNELNNAPTLYDLRRYLYPEWKGTIERVVNELTATLQTFRSCSWCDHLNEMHPNPRKFCGVCGHRADLPRMECDCGLCKQNPHIKPLLEPEDGITTYTNFLNGLFDLIDNSGD